MKRSVDANIVVRFVTDNLSPEMLNRWARWRDDGDELIVPSLIGYEVTNAVYRMMRAGMLNDQQAAAALDAFDGVPLNRVADLRVHQSAVLLAQRFNLAAAYDAHYLAVSERYDVELWTADKRFFNAVHHGWPLIRLGI